MQQYSSSVQEVSELAAAFLQTGVTLGIALICLYLYRRYRKGYFGFWAFAWLLFALRLGVIIGFQLTDLQGLLYWHQVFTGWTALVLLAAALAFSQQIRWRAWHGVLLAFPPVWSYVAIYRLDDFLLAAGPAVAFLSAAAAWTAWVFWRHHRSVGSKPAALMAWAFLLWSLHHLDYPFLRARGAWNPWGYYLDIIFVLAVGGGILLLVVEDQRRGLGVLSALSGDLQRGGRLTDLIRALLERPLTLPAVSGSALYRRETGVSHASGSCSAWVEGALPEEANEAIREAIEQGHPRVLRGHVIRSGTADRPGYTAALPVFNGSVVDGALVVVGRARDPFAVLDEDFLIALGHQVGAALANADLYQRLEDRTAELERLAARMVQQHEEERGRVARELHDETAQVLAALRLQLGMVREQGEPEQAESIDRALDLIDSGIGGIRRVASALRPSLLDDLGLVPALRAIAAEFAERTSIDTRFRGLVQEPALSPDAELALFRALQEGLANVARHAGARAVEVALERTEEGLRLIVRDDGRGPGAVSREAAGDLSGELDGEPLTTAAVGNGDRQLGLLGMKERMLRFGGDVRLSARPDGGTSLEVRLPLEAE
jgi:signal transduction histidine kinase